MSRERSELVLCLRQRLLFDRHPHQRVARMTTDRIDAYCSFPHYASHIAPILDALPDERRGHVYGPSNRRREMPEGTRFDVQTMYLSDAPLLVAGAQDLNHSRRRKIFVEHGAGQKYEGAEYSPSYAGGPGRELAQLFLVPNQDVADRNLARYPHARAAVVGCPKVDAYLQVPKPNNAEPVVAVAFHWDCRLRSADTFTTIPESGWAFPTWRDAIAELAKSVKVLGHGHPRARRELEPWYASVGIESVWTVEELLERADVLVVDNSSLGFEWAACDRPSVWLDDESWRRDVHHGLRFWEDLPGPCMVPSLASARELRDAINTSLTRYVLARADVTERVYGGPVDGKSAARAAQAILDWEQEVC